MYQNIAIQNPLLAQFNGYMNQNPNIIPFQNNQLLSNNPHVLNNLNVLVQEHKIVQQNMPQYQQQIAQQAATQSNVPVNSSINSQKMIKRTGTKNANIIKEMLKPQAILKNDNKDVNIDYNNRNIIRKKAKKGEIDIEITNAPYKNIIKDKIINKKWMDVTKEDLVVHHTDKAIDANPALFDKEVEMRETETETINTELNIEFHIDNYDRHKKKFDYKESFIKNMAFEQNTYDESKQDYVDFYRKKQKEAEEGQKICDQILHNIIDEGVIGTDELPLGSEDAQATKNDIDLQAAMNNIQTSEDPHKSKPIITTQSHKTISQLSREMKTNKTKLSTVMAKKSNNPKPVVKNTPASSTKKNIPLTKSVRVNSSEIVEV